MPTKSSRFILGLGLGATIGYLGYLIAFARRQLAQADPARTLASDQNTLLTGRTFTRTRQSADYTVEHTIEDGIERIVYHPAEKKYANTLLMQHGMWHGAWCWGGWQELFARWGWESVAVSLPGHAGSPVQRPIPLCTLDYYLSFLKHEVERVTAQGLPPVLMGHSMGGALTQWYLKYVGDLPAAVLVASWAAQGTLPEGIITMTRLDPLMYPLIALAWDAYPMVRSPRVAARLLLGKNAIISPQELHSRLGRESELVLFQHNPPAWTPPAGVKTPVLWLAGGKDATITEPTARRSAEFYHADYIAFAEAGHNLMMERRYQEIAWHIHAWLANLVQPVPAAALEAGLSAGLEGEQA